MDRGYSRRFLSIGLGTLGWCAAAPTPTLGQATECPDQVQSVTVEVTDLSYIECGDGEAVIFVHGSTGDLQWALPHMEALAPDFRAVSYSRRFHPPNAAPREGARYTLQDHVSDLVGLIAELGFERAHIVGHSYGAYVALGLAVDHPELVRSLVLGEPPVLPLLGRTKVGTALRESWNDQIRDPARQAAQTGDMNVALGLFLDAVVFPGWFAGLDADQRAEMVGGIGPEFRLELLTESEAYMPPLPCPDLGGIAVPTLLLTGETSLASLYLVTAELERCLQDESHVMVPGTGHVMFANTDFVNPLLWEFLSN